MNPPLPPLLETIPRVSEFSQIPGIVQERTEDSLKSLLQYFGGRFGRKLVLYGGQTATPWVWGRKHIRSATTDLEYAVEAPTMDALAGDGPLWYHSRHDILCTVRGGIPVTFAWRRIHEWPISPAFFIDARIVETEGGPLCACSPEFSVCLKMMRLRDCIRTGRSLFGKDALDIMNIAVNRVLKPSRLVSLLKHEAGLSGTEFGLIADFLAIHEDHLNAAELPVFRQELRRLRLCWNHHKEAP